MGENGSVDLGVLDLIGLPAKTGDLRFMDMVEKYGLPEIRDFTHKMDLCMKEVEESMTLYLFPLAFFTRNLFKG